MTTEEALTLVRIVRAAFPAQRLDEFTIDVWVDALRDADFGECRNAIRRLVTKQTFASVAEILTEARDTRREGTRRILNTRTLHEIETARDAHERDHQAAYQAYLETRQAFRDALDSKKREAARPVNRPAAAAPVDAGRS